MKITRSKLISIIKEEVEAYRQELSEMGTYNRGAAMADPSRDISSLIADAIRDIMKTMPPAEARAKILSMSVGEIMDMAGIEMNSAMDAQAASTALGRQQRAVRYAESKKK